MRHITAIAFSYCACLCVVLPAHCICFANPPGPSAEAGANNKPSAIDPDALGKLKDILSRPKNRLELSTEKGSASEKFYLLLKLEPRGGGKLDRSVNTLIAR